MFLFLVFRSCSVCVWCDYYLQVSCGVHSVTDVEVMNVVFANEPDYCHVFIPVLNGLL